MVRLMSNFTGKNGNSATKRYSVLHDLLYETYTRILVSSNGYLPNILPPFKIEGHEYLGDILVVRCGSRPMSLHDLDPDWFFELVYVYEPSSRSWIKVPMLASRNYKLLIWSIFKSAVLFLGEPFRPMFDPETMFVGIDGNVVFTAFEDRDMEMHGEEYEAGEIGKFIKKVSHKKAKGTLPVAMDKELDAFAEWLLNHDLLILRNEKCLETVFNNVLLWCGEIRTSYVSHLHDCLEANLVDISTLAALAFCDKDGQNNDDWRKMIMQSGNPVLDEMLHAADRDYSNKINAFLGGQSNREPSIKRKNILGTNAKAILEEGLTKVRDSLEHAFENQGKSSGSQPRYTAEDILYSFQDIFPFLMIELGKVIDEDYVNSFDIIGYIKNSLLAPSSICTTDSGMEDHDDMT